MSGSKGWMLVSPSAPLGGFCVFHQRNQLSPNPPFLLNCVTFPNRGFRSSFLVAAIVVHRSSSPLHTFGKAEIEKLESENGHFFSPFHTLGKSRFAIVCRDCRRLKRPKKQTIALRRKRNFFCVSAVWWREPAAF